MMLLNTIVASDLLKHFLYRNVKKISKRSPATNWLNIINWRQMIYEDFVCICNSNCKSPLSLVRNINIYIWKLAPHISFVCKIKINIYWIQIYHYSKVISKVFMIFVIPKHTFISCPIIKKEKKRAAISIFFNI